METIEGTVDIRGLVRPGAVVGGADRDRTDDPLLAKQMLSQLSYSPSVLSEELKIRS